MTDDEEDVSGGGVRLQVDRKRLEAMITGKPVYGTSILLPNANDFFDKVASLSGAQILWPRELKIGAKTKKDPYVKIIGTPEQVDSARQLISATLQRKRDRVTLKLLISHESHSHIIGRGGRGSKRIMQASACHIHFPDANRHGSNGYVDASQPMDEIKGDQVSVTGAPEHAERARALLRENSLVVVSFELPWFGPSPPPLPTLLPQITASINSLPPAYIITLRSATQDVAFLKESISIITAKLVPHACWTPELRAEFRSSALLLQPQATMLRTLFELAEFENVRVRLYGEQRSVLMCGSFEGVVRVREFLIQQLPVTLCFDCPNERLPASLKEIEKQFDVEATVKRRTSIGGGGSSAALAATAGAYSTSAADHSVIVLRTREELVARLYHTREHILGLEHSERPLSQAALASAAEAVNSAAGAHSMHQPAPPIEAADANGDVNGNEMLFHALVDADISSLEQQFASAAVASSPNTIPQRPSSLLSPNPTDSPIAHSLLKSAKEIDNNKKSEIWRTDEGVMARQELLLKANRAVFDSSFHHIRYPTDLWSGLGFSASLPADLIRAAAASDAHVEADEHEDDEHDFSREGSSSSSSLSLLHNSSSTPLALPAGLAGSNSFHSSPSRTGLASVIEDEELSEYNTSTLDFSRKQRMPSKKKKLLSAPAPAIAATATNPPPRQSNSFSASSSFFETASPIGHDLPWDVDVFRDPAMVLAQLGCSEYLPQFRAQEIDMRALLLSDEQSLKEIGVATVGARKKIAHAILKLRESARAKGYDI